MGPVGDFLETVGVIGFVHMFFWPSRNICLNTRDRAARITQLASLLSPSVRLVLLDMPPFGGVTTKHQAWKQPGVIRT